MSELSYMEKLLDGVEVEWRSLGEIYNFQYGKGNTIPKTGGEYPVYGSNGIVGSHHEYNSEDAPVIGHIGAYAGIVNWGKGKHFVTYNGVICRMKSEEVLPQYAYYILLLQNFGEKSNSASQPFVSYHILETPVVPIPPLKIQAEIVRVLDAFTELTAELTAELVSRKQQYAYYREKLFNAEDNDFEWKTLGEVTKKWYSGGTPRAGTPEYYEGGNIPWLRTQEVKFNDIEETNIKITPAALKNSSAKWIPEDCVIIAISRATAGRSAINKISLTTNQHCGCLEIDSTKALYKYVFHWVGLNYENIKALGQGARGDLNSSIIRNFGIPIPYADNPEKSLSEQQRIVTILDKFDALTTSLTEGLPREIALRQQQYEYYRELLLSFPKAEVAIHD